MTLLQHTAPGPMYGYLYQVERAVCWLLSCAPGMMVGIESLDDLAVIDGNGKIIILEQTKATTGDANNIGDGSEALWKTLSIWATALEAGEVNGKLAYFYLVTTADVPMGLGKTLSNAKKQPDVMAALELLRDTGASAPMGTRRFVEAVLSCTENTLTTLISRFVLRDKSMGALEGIGQTLAKQPVLVDCDPITCEAIADSLWGWVARRTAESIRAKRPTWISRDALSRELTRHIGLQYDIRRKRRVLETAQRLVVTPNQRAAQKDSIFVKQLRIIGCPDDTIIDAVDDFLRAGIDRVNWAAEADELISEEELAQFDDDLQKHWRLMRLNYYSPATSNEAEAELVVGRQIYANTMLHKETLAGQPTQHMYTTRGRYHWLANGLKVGWHPRYTNLLTAEGDEHEPRT